LIILVNNFRFKSLKGLPQGGPSFFGTRVKLVLKLFFLFLLSHSNALFSQDLRGKPGLKGEASEGIPEKRVIETPSTESLEPKTPLDSAQRRKSSIGSLMLGYQMITTWLPSKKNLSYTHIFNQDLSLEAEVSWMTLDRDSFIGVDFGAVRERRFTLQARRFVANSFHYLLGVVYSDFSAKLGREVVDQFGGEISQEAQGQNLGVCAGLGNRWQLNHGVTWGIDWIRVNIPIIETRSGQSVLTQIASEGERQDLKKVIRTFNRIPNFVFFGISAGYSF
jgi:hypothetical protein